MRGTVLPRLLVAAAHLLLGPAALAGPAVPTAEDIPKPGRVQIGLAGVGDADPTRYFLAQGPQGAIISPDGRSVAYVSSITGEPQLWIVSGTGGAPRQLTFGLGITGAVWVPDGNSILYVADKGGDERLGIYTVSLDGSHEREVVARSDAFIYPGDFTSDGAHFVYASTARDGRSFDLYSASLDGTGSALVMRGRPGLYPVAVQPHGNMLIAQEARGEDAADVSLIDLASGREVPLLHPRDAAGNDGFAWLPDGTGFYLASNQDRDLSALALYDLKSSTLRFVDAPKFDVVATALSPDGRYLVWATDETGYVVLHARSTRTGKAIAIPKLPSGNYTMAFARAAPVLVLSATGPATPGEVWRWDLKSGNAAQVVWPTSAGLELSKMAVPRTVAFKSRDGLVLTGLLYVPRISARPPPVFLRLHGGPSSHARAIWRPEIQNLVAHGIAVLDFNYRGSTGSGKAFARLNDRRLRPNELGDLSDAVRWIRDQSWLDGTRVAVGGASYGGYLTNAIIGAYPDLFVAAVSEVGVMDWVRNLEGAAPDLKASDLVEYGDVHDPGDRAFFESISPMRNVAKIKTPLLLEAGANDPRDEIGEQDDFVSAIRAAGGHVKYMRYEAEGHVLRNLPDIIDFNRAKADFLMEHLGPR